MDEQPSKSCNEESLEVIVRLLRLGRQKWCWETLVEKVAVAEGLTAGDRGSEAVCAAADALRRRYPNKAARLWNSLEPEGEAPHILALIRSQFEDIVKMSDQERYFDIAKSDRRAEELSKTLVRYYETLLHGEKVTHGTAELTRSAAVYALWRYRDIEAPAYIGETKNLARRMREHLAWWGSAPLYLRFVATPEMKDDLMRLLVERFAIAACDPGVNAK